MPKLKTNHVTPEINELSGCCLLYLASYWADPAENNLEWDDVSGTSVPVHHVTTAADLNYGRYMNNKVLLAALTDAQIERNKMPLKGWVAITPRMLNPGTHNYVTLFAHYGSRVKLVPHVKED